MVKEKEFIKNNYSEEDSKKIFFTSDTHFHHANVIRYCKRPFSSIEEMDEALINNWNKTVPPDGIVFHLGDFCFGGSREICDLIFKLNGRIILIKGNHDKISKSMESMFDYVTDEMNIRINKRRVILNHYALLTYAGCNNNAIQLFGHSHTGPHKKWKKGRFRYLLPTQYDVGVDNNNFKPVSWKEITEIIDTQCKKKKSIIQKILNWIMSFQSN